MKQRKILFAAAFLIAVVAEVSAQEWSQYLGPNRNSTSDQKGILRSWPKNGPEVLWTVNVGPGYGGPVVKDGNYVYSCCHNGDLYCIDINTHKPVWI